MKRKCLEAPDSKQSANTQCQFGEAKFAKKGNGGVKLNKEKQAITPLPSKKKECVP
jgi:spore germination protein GerM